MPTGKILILTDGKAGHENQSRAFARALGRDALTIRVKFRSPFHKALSYLLDNVGARSQRLFEIQPPDEVPPAEEVCAVVGTGSGTFYAAKTLARRLGVRCGVVLYPRGYRISSFDCILAPAFDRPPKAPNVIEIPANLVANDESFYAEGTRAFLERHPVAQDVEAVAVIVGGPNKCSTMTAAWMRAELERLFAENAAAPDGRRREFWATTSRRTPPDVEAVVDSFPFDYKLIYSRDRFNPIPAFVSLARTLYVTAESTGMLSEACTFGSAEVRVLDNLKPGPHKFRRFAESCAALRAKKIDTSGQIAAARALLGLG